MNTKEAIAVIAQTLKENSFKKRNNNWNRAINDHLVWVVNLQKGRMGTKVDITMTINVGVYVVGTCKILFEKEFDFVTEPSRAFLGKGPAFFGFEKDWWKFDENSDNSLAAFEMDQLIKDRIIPFLENNSTFDRLVTYLPIEKWIGYTNYHIDLVRVGIGYYILGNYAESERLLRAVINGQTCWAEASEKGVEFNFINPNPNPSLLLIKDYAEITSHNILTTAGRGILIGPGTPCAKSK